MCGIAGIIALHDAASPPRHAALTAMCRTMQHRGPDDRAVDVQQRVGFGFQRLSVIDLQHGNQPIYNENRSVRVIFNGEIYNYRELRRMLEQHGHRFSTSTDTEVIVHLWEQYGTAFAHHLNGMFALAIHDIASQRMVLARDHFGIKPLYYSLTGDHLVFGSEVKVLLASGLVETSLDVDSLGQLLSWEYVPGRSTLLKGVRKLEAASMLDIDLAAGTAEIQQYWDAFERDCGSVRSDDQWEDAIDHAIAQSVQRQVVSDVPLGAFLSGGVDSSLVVAAMQSPKTFSIGFDDPSYNELPWSQRVAQHLGSRHRTETIRPNAVELFDHLMQFMDDPIGDVSIFPTYLVSQLARSEVTVALSGDGGDEIFGGYETYLAQEKAAAWRRVPLLVRSGMIEPAVRAIQPRAQKKGLINKAKRFVEGLEHADSLGHARWRLFVGEAMRQAIFTPEAKLELLTPIEEHIADLSDRMVDRDAVDRALYIDMRSYLVDNCLTKVDRMSMACSLEVRVPLLDREVVELAWSMPSRLKVCSGKTKVMLKRVACRHLPRQCVHRPKEGFSIPMKQWLCGQFRPLVDDLLNSKSLAGQGLFNIHAIERLKAEHFSNKANHSHVLWTLLVFQEWRRRWSI